MEDVHFFRRMVFVKFREKGEKRSFPRSAMLTPERNILFILICSWICIYPVKRQLRLFCPGKGS